MRDSATLDNHFKVIDGGLSVNEIMRRSRLAAARRKRLKKIEAAAFIILLIAIFSAIIFTSIVKAQEKRKTDTARKGYMYITVECGDTLWDIAAQYSDEHYNSVYQYIREMKELNGLTSDSIHAGAKLIIPVYIK